MEQHPDLDELILNERLRGFAKRILDNDLLATAVVKVANEHAPNEAGWEYQSGEPSLCALEDGRFSGGIQLGYRNHNPETRSTARKFIYTDFFIINPENGENELSDQVKAVVDNADPEIVWRMVEVAWQLWLSELHSMVQRVNSEPKEGFVEGIPDAMKLFVDKYTGEIGFGYNMPPGHAIEINLPPLGQPFRL